jgi:hypothetical protein
MRISKDAVARVWRDDELKPWRVRAFQVCNGPAFEDEVTDVVVERYMDPPDRAGMFSFDEKPQS